MEFIDSNTYCIENSYKKYYSSVFNQRAIKHNPNKYCKNWLLQLQGKERVNISSENFNKIINLAQQWFNHDKGLENTLQCGTSNEVSCIIIRNFLKYLLLTKYNPHITWLRKQIEYACDIKGYSYELTNDERYKILEYFNEIVTQFSYLISKHKIHNIIYYPYFIARILTLVIHDQNRLNILLSNVHFQKKVTIVKNENIWKELCGKLNYEYIPLSSTVYEEL